LTTNANDFRHQSGAYELALVIGDALVQNSFAWKVNDQTQLKFHDDSKPDTDHQDLYRPKKEIIHQFREQEKRPPTIVSLVFSGLTVFPLLILLILVS
jgi:oligosaccharyltransferase complex subunit delta (ribophorin II)